MRIIIADDHPFYREAVRIRLLRTYPGSRIDEAGSFDEILALAGDGGAVDLILADLHMPGEEQAGTFERVVRAFPHTPVALMSGLAAVEDVRSAVAAGVRAYLPKTLTPEIFAGVLAILLAGGTYIPAAMLQGAGAPPDPLRGPATKEDAGKIDALTPRERQVLVCLSSGSSNKEIGRDLDLAEITVKLHVRQILKKIGLRNRSEAAVFAARAGLI